MPGRGPDTVPALSPKSRKKSRQKKKKKKEKRGFGVLGLFWRDKQLPDPPRAAPLCLATGLSASSLDALKKHLEHIKDQARKEGKTATMAAAIR